MRDRPGTTGSSWKVDSGAMMESTAHTEGASGSRLLPARASITARAQAGRSGMRGGISAATCGGESSGGGAGVPAVGGRAVEQASRKRAGASFFTGPDPDTPGGCQRGGTAEASARRDQLGLVGAGEAVEVGAPPDLEGSG